MNTSAPSIIMSVRQALPADAQILADFNRQMALETEHITLDPPTVLAGCQAALADPAKGLYFVAEIAGQVAGQLLITREWSDWRNGDIWWLQSVYVHPTHRRRGLFKALFRHVEDQARRCGVVALRLYVEQANAAAQSTYQKLGMQTSHYRVMELSLKAAPPPL